MRFRVTPDDGRTFDRATVPWVTYLLIVVLVCAVAAVLIFAFYYNSRITQVYGPLRQLTHEINLEVNSAKLLFEKTQSQKYVDAIYGVWEHLDRADGYLQLAIEGGDHEGHVIVPWADVRFQNSIKNALEKLRELRNITPQVTEFLASNLTTEDVQELFAATTAIFSYQIEEQQGALRAKIEETTKILRAVEIVFLSFFLVLTVVVGIAFFRLERRRARAINSLHDINAQLEIEIVERTRVEKNAREGEAKLRTILNSVLTGVVIIDGETYEIVDVNPVAEGMIGLSKDRIIGHTCHPFICPTKKGTCPITDLRQRIDKSECFLINGKGEKIPILKTVNSVDLSGRAYLVESFVDMSEHKKLTEGLQKAKRTAEMADTVKSQFLANMSHELRTPMNGVIGMTELLLGTDMTLEQREFAQVVQKSANALLAVIDQVLEFTHFETDQNLDMHDFELNKLVEEVVDLLADQAAQKNLDLSFLIRSDVPTLVQGDVDRLRRVLLNLGNNAVKFTEKGKISIEVSLDEPQKTMEEKSGQVTVRFRIIDTGIGIPPHKKDELFQSFSQADSSMSRKYGGTGLGLAMSKRQVELLGGDIGFESEQGRGATFWFTVPLKKQTQNREKQPRPTSIIQPASGLSPVAAAGNGETTSDSPQPVGEMETRKARILLAEDNPINQKVAVLILKKLGYEAHVVSNGKEVVQALEQSAYDLVLMDIQMPEMDGLTAATVIRDSHSHVKNHQIPILALTSHIHKDDRQRCLEHGMNGFLCKPIEPQALAKAIEEALG